MIIDCLSDLHGHHPSSLGDHLLIISGDLTKINIRDEHLAFLYSIHVNEYYELVNAPIRVEL